MFRKCIIAGMMLIFLFVLGCSAHTHNVGAGASGVDKASQRQWYILYGLIPLNNVDTNAIAADATDYTIKTETGFVDIVIGMFTGIITVNSRTVTVTK